MRMVRNIVLGSIALGIIAVVVWLNPFEWKVKAGLHVRTNGVPASLFLDGEFLDKSPYINKKIQPKEYILRIEPDSAEYAPYELPVTLHKGTIAVVDWTPGKSTETSGGAVYEMEKGGRATQLVFHTIPDGAIMSIDGGEKQFSPLILNDVSEGDYALEASLPSYQTQQHSVRVLSGHRVTVTVILGKAEAENRRGASGETPAEPTTPENQEASAITGPRVQIVTTNFFFNNQEVLRVREAPSPAGRELGFAPVGNSYPYLAEQTGWFQIEFEGTPGWVSAQFSQKVATESSQPTP